MKGPRDVRGPELFAAALVFVFEGAHVAVERQRHFGALQAKAPKRVGEGQRFVAEAAMRRRLGTERLDVDRLDDDVYE